MAYQKVTTTSYGSRLKNALQGVGMGFLMIIAGTVLLFWNEGRTVKTTRMLRHAQKECVELGDIQQLSPEMDGKMIHACGEALTQDILIDPDFGLAVNAVKLSRRVEYYQWVEHSTSQTKDKVGGGQETVTTYTYSKEWVGTPVNSSGFEDPAYRGVNNDVLLRLEDRTSSARNVSFGAYRFPDGLISQMNQYQPCTVELGEEVRTRFENEFHREFDVPASTRFVHTSGNQIYLGADRNNPTVGDVRVSFTCVLPGEVSILALVSGDSFGKYTDKNGYSLMSLVDGNVSLEGMFESEHSSNKTMSWILRVLGILLVFFGFKNIFNLITQLLKVLPFLANIANLGVNLVSGVLAAAWCLVVIAIGWLAYRPVLAVALIAAALCLILFLGKKSKEKQPAEITV